jgi:hypothetical protein
MSDYCVERICQALRVAELAEGPLSRRPARSSGSGERGATAGDGGPAHRLSWMPVPSPREGRAPVAITVASLAPQSLRSAPLGVRTTGMQLLHSLNKHKG